MIRHVDTSAPARLPSVLVFAACLTGFAAACGEAPPDDGSSVSWEETLATDLAEAYCQAGATCCEAAGMVPNAACVTTRRAEYLARLEVVRESRTVQHVDPRAVRRCLAEVKWARGQCTWDVDPLILTGDTICRDLWGVPGSAGPGEACSADLECEAPARGKAQCESVCRHLFEVDDGSACGQGPEPNVWWVCGPDSYCDGHCRPLPAVGEACEQGRCRAGSACLPVDGAATCVLDAAAPGRIDGEDCDRADHCASGFCDPDVGMCLPDPAPGRSGDACGTASDCLSGACGGGRTASGTCRPVTVGEAGMINERTCEVK